MNTITTDYTHLIVQNDLEGTVTKTTLPETVEEAMENCLAIKQAVDHAEDLTMFDYLYGPQAPESDPSAHLGVTVRKAGNTVCVRWWAAGDAERAKERLATIMGGRAHE